MSNTYETREIRETNDTKKVDGTIKSTFTKVVDESKAEGKVLAIYDDIKKTLGLKFIPNMYKAMALNPNYLELTWKRVKAIMGKDSKLDQKTKDIIALTVSIMSGSTYCINVYNEAVRHNGFDDEAISEIYAIIDVYSGLNRFNIAQQTKKDDKPWFGCGS